MNIFKQGCQKKWDHSYNNDKNLVSHILFLRKRGLIVYLTALKKGAIRAAQLLRHPLREREVEGSIPSVGGSGVRSDMTGW